MKLNKWNVVDLFAGCGGLSYGFQEMGYSVTVANEMWEPAAKTYEINHKNTTLVVGDITKEEVKQKIVSKLGKKKCDVLVGGPPCQAYSVAGLRKPDDPRGTLFEDYMKMVERLQPKVFVMENVKGLLSIKTEKEDLNNYQKGKINQLNKLKNEKTELIIKRRKSKNSSKIDFTKQDEIRFKEIDQKIKDLKKKTEPFQEKLVDKIMRKFKEIGYNNVSYKVLNSANYGVPQVRERVIFIGTRYDVPIEFPKITHNEDASQNLNKWINVKEAIDDLKDKEENIATNHILTVHSKDFLKKIKQTKIGSSVFGTYSHAFHRPNPNKPSRTVKENHGGVFVHYQKDRVMTPRELARLQSFPDYFLFNGPKNHILTQIGNAVPPLLGEALGKSIAQMLSKIEKL